MTTTPSTKGTGKPVNFSATLGQLKTLASGRITFTLSSESSEVNKILRLMTACQAGNSLAISAQVVKAKPKPKSKEDAKKKPDTQKKGPRRVRRYPYK